MTLYRCCYIVVSIGVTIVGSHPPANNVIRSTLLSIIIFDLIEFSRHRARRGAGRGTRVAIGDTQPHGEIIILKIGTRIRREQLRARKSVQNIDRDTS